MFTFFVVIKTKKCNRLLHSYFAIRTLSPYHGKDKGKNSFEISNSFVHLLYRARKCRASDS